MDPKINQMRDKKRVNYSRDVFCERINLVLRHLNASHLRCFELWKVGCLIKSYANMGLTGKIDRKINEAKQGSP